ncbi:MAG: sigma-70 family RNA polymerase sigma factor [Terriglobia bacterium]
MATQFAPASHALSTAAATLGPSGYVITESAPSAPVVPPRRRRKEKTVQDRQKLLVEMLPLVKRVALKIRKRLPAHVEMDDLCSDGVLGLIDAVIKFDPSKRVKLETYARRRICGSILDGLRGADSASRDIRRKSKEVQKLYHELEVKLGCPVTDEEMAAVQGMNLAQWHRELNELQSAGLDCGARTLSAAPTSPRASIESAFLARDDPNPFELGYRNEQLAILDRAVSRLQERDRQIVTLYHRRGLTMRQIADLMRVDESRVSQLHAVALDRLMAHVDTLLRPRQTEPSQASALPLAAAGA